MLIISGMTWLSVTRSVLFYLSLPFIAIIKTALNTLTTAFAPLTHLIQYVGHGLLLPLQILGRFEVQLLQAILDMTHDINNFLNRPSIYTLVLQP